MEHQVFDVILGLAEDVSTPRAVSVAILIRYGEWAELQKLRCVQTHYLEAEAYWRDNLITEILRKCDLPTTVDREQAAIDTFLACEKANCRTNVRLNRFLPNSLLIEEGEGAVMDFISLWRKDVHSVMGNLPESLCPRFGQGATYADTGQLTTAPDKMSSRPTVYRETRDLIPLWSETAWSRSLVETRPYLSGPRTVRGNIFFTVPKDGTKYRGCCKEASIPVSYQLDVGRILKIRLLRIGINLRRGKEVHMQIARSASRTNAEATIDMSNASDTLSRVLPKLVLREDWFALLDSLRATHTRVGGKWFRLEKFSSMGNGFTFELETIIFATMARTVVRLLGGNPDSVRCYGDDLIVPSFTAPSVIKALQWFGFEPNMKKTFIEGPFRESCGGDFWDGVPVRGHYLEELPDEPQQWISLVNGLRRVAFVDGQRLPSRWSTVSRTWRSALARIPSDIRRCVGPSWLGDVVINDDNPASWNTRRLNHHIGWAQQTVSAYIPIPVILPWAHWKAATQLAAALIGYGSEGVTPRDGVSGYAIRRIPIYGSGWLPGTASQQTDLS
jgi:hypothetical protein